MKKSSVVNVDVLSKELSRTVQLEDDFVWVDKQSAEIMPDVEPPNLFCDSTSETDQGSDDLRRFESERDDEAVDALDRYSNKELLVENEYWDQYDSVKRFPTSKPKCSSHKRLGPRDDFIINRHKTIARHPSFYKFEESTTLLLEKLQKDILLEYHNVVGRGKNSVVIHATQRNPPNHWQNSRDVAVKVYKLSLDLKKNEAIFKRVQREYNCLALLNQHGVYGSPSKIFKRRNIIVMTFTGPNQESALSIKTSPVKLPVLSYKDFVGQMIKLYKKCNIIHGNLCSKTIVVWCGYVHMIGWAHSVDRGHPLAMKKLMKDCYYVTKYYAQKGVPVDPVEDLFQQITGVEKISTTLLNMINKKN